MSKRKPDDYEPDADEDNIMEQEGDGQYIVAWGVELVTNKTREKSQMFSARRLVLGCDSVFIEMADGQEVTYPVDQIKKILAMKSTLPAADETT